MTPLRTRSIDLDRDFTVVGEVAKMRVDEKTGERYITGLASGVAEDRDGERVSTNAITKMVAQPVDDLVLTSSHDQDWLTEIGVVTKHWHDAEHDELWVETMLPPEGEDPIADKAWRKSQEKPLGFSIGGKLRKAFRELVNENGVTKQRKVLDDIWLRHYALTQKPAYASSFAEAVAKTFDGAEPNEDEFLEEGVLLDRTEEVRKAAKEREAGDPTDGQPGESDPPAATGDEKPPAKDEPAKDDGDGDDDAKADQEAADALPMAKRHLSCPHCGHEFAAPLSADEAGNRKPDEDVATDADGDTNKTTSTDAPEPTKDMSTNATDLNGALEKVRALADVAKTETAPAAPAETVEKTETTDLVLADVAKAVAAVDAASSAALTDLREHTAAGFESLVDVVKSLQETVAALPLGRKSVARTVANERLDGDVTKTATPETADEIRKAIADLPADDVLGALRLTNEATARGIQL